MNRHVIQIVGEVGFGFHSKLFFWILFFLMVGLPLSLSAAPPPQSPDSSLMVKTPSLDSGTTAKDPTLDSGSNPKTHSFIDSNFIFEYIAHPVLGLVTWPIEKVVVPAFGFAFYPLEPPINYVIKEEVIEKTVDLISFGPDNKHMLYPLIGLSLGTTSQTGIIYRNKSFLDHPNQHLVLKYRYFVNGDQKVEGRFGHSKILGTKWSTGLSSNYRMYKSRPFDPFYGMYSDTTVTTDITLSRPLFDRFGFYGMFLHAYSKLGDPHIGDTLKCESNQSFFHGGATCLESRALRGINENFYDLTYMMGFTKNTVNNSNIPSSGDYLDFNWAYHSISGNHDFHLWQSRYVRYFFLGVERYEITPAEQRKMGVPTFTKIKRSLQYSNLKKEIFNRKVIAVQVRLAQAYEIDGNYAPVYVLQSIGNSTPLRGLSGSPDRDYASGSFSLEYRIPIMRLVEGTLFNEYGIVDKSITTFDYLNDYYNSWGFGLQFAHPSIFLFRAQIGFAGWSPIPRINLTIDTTY